MDLIEIIKQWCKKEGINFSEVLPDGLPSTLIINVPEPHMLRQAIKDNIPHDKLVRLKKKRNGTELRVIEAGINDSKNRSDKMSYIDKINKILSDDINESQYKYRNPPTKRLKARNKRAPAKRPVAENQYKTYISPTSTIKNKSEFAPKGKSKLAPVKPQEVISITEVDTNDDGFIKKASVFKVKLIEALEGLATKDNLQPQELIGNFMAALDEAGKSIDLGVDQTTGQKYTSVRHKLESMGIKIAQSNDKQALIVYNRNMQTKAIQPMMSITIDSLSDNNKFTEAVQNCLDYAKGDAPGAFKRRQEAMRDQETAIRDVIDRIGPDNLKVDTEDPGDTMTRNI